MRPMVFPFMSSDAMDRDKRKNNDHLWTEEDQ